MRPTPAKPPPGFWASLEKEAVLEEGHSLFLPRFLTHPNLKNFLLEKCLMSTEQIATIVVLIALVSLLAIWFWPRPIHHASRRLASTRNGRQHEGS
jgi:hypothetical protein